MSALSALFLLRKVSVSSHLSPKFKCQIWYFFRIPFGQHEELPENRTIWWQERSIIRRNMSDLICIVSFLTSVKFVWSAGNFASEITKGETDRCLHQQRMPEASSCAISTGQDLDKSFAVKLWRQFCKNAVNFSTAKLIETMKAKKKITTETSSNGTQR